MEERFIELEKKIAFQENVLEELSEALNTQYKKIEDLEKQIETLKVQLSEESLVKPIEEEEPPPHY